MPNRSLLLVATCLASLASASCGGDGDCDTVGVTNAPFVACDQLGDPLPTPVCGAPPLVRLHSSGTSDAGVRGTCAASMRCGYCTLENPSAAGTYLPSVCVLATESGSRDFVLDATGDTGMCAVPCGDPAFPCTSPATCVNATSAETGGIVAICQLP